MDNKEFWQLQKAANLSNSECASFLEINISTIKRYRNGSLQAPKAVMMSLWSLAENKPVKHCMKKEKKDE